MKLSIVAIALVLVCFVSFVLAADQPVTMTTPMSEAGRMQLAKAIKEAISRNPSAVDPAIAAMSTEDIFRAGLNHCHGIWPPCDGTMAPTR
ncbi:hypothetical protein PF005_g4590 [Phytophthora fragariae]|uniref:RxLR effector protein n=1 Tax=Phytophthora fragariae TaxID=53985 RepID=A0A6A3Z2U4_9STRA|nr:hypothetical protein PF003_g1141 [Phytophthora fragariae]KAE9127088.1 hypothetical protein PF010_g5056 [Phytophthora fragariae]KAE9227777.1 hypothetical protein PF005_g4590 [Phytophthora fragariae]KAE9246659.1 hypothetical protein PF002_g6652 [Phytophthora fragariae]KAE9322890.1 hypothetical protein PF001_g4197 [Phytophthora fragariae]